MTEQQLHLCICMEPMLEIMMSGKSQASTNHVSGALQVAQLAGIPAAVVHRARQAGLRVECRLQHILGDTCSELTETERGVLRAARSGQTSELQMAQHAL